MSLSGLPPLTWLRAFEASARHLSFTQAAQELNLTQSAVSQHVRSLEGFLGRPLFVRRTRALKLTEAGSNYLPTIREAFDLLARGTRSFTGGDPGRLLTLQCNLAFSVYWLAPRLTQLYDAHPWMVLNIATSIWEPESRVPDHSVEIRFGRPGDLSDAAERLVDDQFYPVCRSDYQNGAYDLETARLFDCAGVVSTWDHWAKQQDRVFGRSADINLASTYLVGLNAAIEGGAMALGHDTLCARHLKDGVLIKPFEGSSPLIESYFLLGPANHDATPASRAFINWVKNEMSA